MMLKQKRHMQHVMQQHIAELLLAAALLRTKAGWSNPMTAIWLRALPKALALLRFATFRALDSVNMLTVNMS